MSWGFRPIRGHRARATAQSLHFSHLCFSLHRCEQALWLPKRVNIPCLSQRLETQHLILPGISVPLSCPHVRATASNHKIPGLLPHSFKFLDACLIEIAGRAPHCGLPPHSPSPARESSRGSWPPLTPCAPSLLWRSENARPSATRRPQGHFSPCQRGWRCCQCAPLGQRQKLNTPGTDPRRSAFGLCPGPH